MQPDGLDDVYGLLSAALGRVGPDDASLFLATLVLDLVVREQDVIFVQDAIVKAERLTRADDASR